MKNKRSVSFTPRELLTIWRSVESGSPIWWKIRTYVKACSTVRFGIPCGALFVGYKSDQRYCSSTCRSTTIKQRYRRRLKHAMCGL